MQTPPDAGCPLPPQRRGDLPATPPARTAGCRGHPLKAPSSQRRVPKKGRGKEGKGKPGRVERGRKGEGGRRGRKEEEGK